MSRLPPTVLLGTGRKAPAHVFIYFRANYHDEGPYFQLHKSRGLCLSSLLQIKRDVTEAIEKAPEVDVNSGCSGGCRRSPKHLFRGLSPLEPSEWDADLNLKYHSSASRHTYLTSPHHLASQPINLA